MGIAPIPVGGDIRRLRHCSCSGHDTGWVPLRVTLIRNMGDGEDAMSRIAPRSNDP